MSSRKIVFLPEKGHHNRVSGISGEEDDSHQDYKAHPFTGDEAREFYEEIISRPEESIKELTSLRKRQQSVRVTSGTKQSQQLKSKSKRKVKSKDGGASRKSSSSSFYSSMSQMFLYAQNNELEPLKLALSRSSCDVNMRDNFNWTLLMVASHAGHVSIVEHLLHERARWQDVVDQKGRNAADLARLGGHPHVAEMIESSDLEHDGESGVSEDKSANRKRPRGLPESLGVWTVGSHSKKRYSFHCDRCQMTVTDNSRDVHSTSTVHLFSCQHHHCADISYGLTESNRGYQMLLRSGWDPEKGLGPQKQGKMFPVKTVLKQDRQGFGLKESKPRVTHFGAHDREAIRTDRERHRPRECAPKKKDILQEIHEDKQWEVKMRAILNEEDHR